MSKSKVRIDQNTGIARNGRVEPNKENKEIVQSERLAPLKAYAAWIAAADCLYARDCVGDYERAEFFPVFNEMQLSEIMKKRIKDVER